MEVSGLQAHGQESLVTLSARAHHRHVVTHQPCSHQQHQDGVAFVFDETHQDILWGVPPQEVLQDSAWVCCLECAHVGGEGLAVHAPEQLRPCGGTQTQGEVRVSRVERACNTHCALHTTMNPERDAPA